MIVKAEKKTGKKRLPKSLQAATMEQWRKQPSKWVHEHIDIEPAKYRSRDALVEWLATQPLDTHQWCRRQLATGKLTLDSQRSYQDEFLDQMAQPGWYALRCANGVAKTATAALFVLWFMDVFPPDGPGGTKVVTTAGSFGQLKTQLWSEIHTWAARALYLQDDKADCISVRADSLLKTSIEKEPNWTVIARAADRADTFEGVHADNLLILVDEAKAVKEEIFGAFRRILRGGGEKTGQYWFVFLSSPGSQQGTFWEMTDGNLAHRVMTAGLSAYESSRISLDTIAQDAEDLGEDSPLFISMDLGVAPEESEFTLILLSWAQAAVGREVDGPTPRVLGVDVARFGTNESCGVLLEGRKASIVFSHVGQDLGQTLGRIAEVCDRVRVDAIVTDDTGLGGGITDGMKRSSRYQGVKIIPVNFGSKKELARPDRYANMKAEMMFMLRAELKAGYEAIDDPKVGLSLPNDKKLLGQLTRHRMLFDDRQIYSVEYEATGQAAAGGIGQSPDRAHALALANYGRGRLARRQQVEAGGTKLRELNLADAKHIGIAASVLREDF